MATTKDTKSTKSTGSTSKKTTGTAKKAGTSKAAGSSSTNKPAETSAAKTTAKKTTKKKSKAGAVLSTIISVLILIVFAVWFVCGKPKAAMDFDEGLFLYETEQPVLMHLPSTSLVEVYTYEEVTEAQKAYEKELKEKAAAEKKAKEAEEKAAKTEAAETPAAPATKTATSKKSSGSTASASGTTGSNPKADQGRPEDDPLYLGNPSDAMADISYKTNYLMEKEQYTLSYNSETLIPNWAAWHLDTSNLGDADRCDDFRPDPDLPAGWYGVTKADYQYSKYGFDRGHVCPSADRTTTKNDNSMTFLMTNMVPQSPDNNRVIWMHFEKYERDYLAAKQGYEVYIVAGPYGEGGTSGKGTFTEIPINLKTGETLHMKVPASTWKVLIALPSGTNDIKRMEKEAFSIAINVPNEMGMQKTGDWEQFICTIDDIEAMTGYDFFELLPDSLEDKLESAKFEYVKE